MSKSSKKKQIKRGQKSTSTPPPKSPILRYLVLISISIIIIGFIINFTVDKNPSLPLDDNGMVITEDKEHWLVYNTGTASQPLYRKLCEVNPAQGYIFSKEDSIYNPNNKIFYFTPLTDQEPIYRYYVMAVNDRFDKLATSALENITSAVDPNAAKNIFSAKAMGKDVRYYFFEYSEKDTSKSDASFATQAMSIYVDFGKHTVLFVLEGLNENAIVNENQTIKIIETMVSTLQ